MTGSPKSRWLTRSPGYSSNSRNEERACTDWPVRLIKRLSGRCLRETEGECSKSMHTWTRMLTCRFSEASCGWARRLAPLDFFVAAFGRAKRLPIVRNSSTSRLEQALIRLTVAVTSSPVSVTILSMELKEPACLEPRKTPAGWVEHGEDIAGRQSNREGSVKRRVWTWSNGRRSMRTHERNYLVVEGK